MWDAAQGYKKQQTVRHTKMRFAIPTSSPGWKGYTGNVPISVRPLKPAR